MSTFATSAVPATPVAAAPTAFALPALRRLVTHLQLRTFCGLLAQALVLGAGIGVLIWGLALGVLRLESPQLPAMAGGLIAAILWTARHRRHLRPLPVIERAERQLRLHELWTTAWTLPAAPTSGSRAGRELREQVQSRAEVAATAASAAALLPLRLPNAWGVALLLALVGLGTGLRPQPEAGFLPPNPAAGSAADPGPLGGGAPASPQAIPPDAKLTPVKPTAAPALTPAQAELKKQWDALLPKLDTPEKIKQALQQLQRDAAQKQLPADAIAALEKRLREQEQALAAAGNRPGVTPDEPPPGSAPAPALDFAAVSLFGNDHTINPAVLQDVRENYPEYESALARYVNWLAQNSNRQP